MKEITQLLLQHKGKRAMVNLKESQHFGLLVVDVELLKQPQTSISIIENVTDEFLVLNYFDAKEMHYLPMDKIIKVNIILRER